MRRYRRLFLHRRITKRPQALPCFAAAAATVAILGRRPSSDFSSRAGSRGAARDRRADEEAVDAGSAGDGVDVGDGFGRLDLHDEKRLGVGGGRVGERAVEVEIIVEAGAVEAALAERGELHGLGESGGVGRGVDERASSGRWRRLRGGDRARWRCGCRCGRCSRCWRGGACAIRRWSSRRSQVLCSAVEPDGIEAGLGGVRGHHRGRIIHAGDAGGLVLAEAGANEGGDAWAFDVWKSPPATAPRVSIEDYRKNLRHFVEASRNAGAAVILMTPNPLRWTPAMKIKYGKPPYDPARPDGFNLTLVAYVDAMRALAQEMNVPLLDVAKVYAALPPESVDALLPDGMHPNQRGHDLVAQLLADVIRAHPGMIAP
jgi:lysophospholipase L1-like esterase